ncbi:hypothetical protein LJC22_01630 [Desulfosarcina sp. OttesenSCG-928-G10]|nr:hypothetical protein [Desulfosarcina sp. OttesenSCG-928-G10]MDL2321803.1 hypothetical protein [Desulfosarcina sp. OttesenSCG-928-B08]
MTRPVRIAFKRSRFLLKYDELVLSSSLLICVSVMVGVTASRIPDALNFYYWLPVGCVVGGFVFLPLTLIWLFRLQWEKRMTDHLALFVEVDEKALRVVKPNEASLLFEKGSNPFAILVFQERGMDLFCLEISCRHHTPRYFFLGKGKEKAEALLHALGLESFEQRAPIPNAQKNWEPIPKTLNEKLSKQKRSFFIKPQAKENPFKRLEHAVVSRQTIKTMMGRRHQKDDIPVFTCLRKRSVIGAGTIVFWGLISFAGASVAAILCFSSSFLLWWAIIGFGGWSGACWLVWRQALKRPCFFRVTEKNMSITWYTGTSVSYDYTEVCFQKRKETDPMARAIHFFVMTADTGEEVDGEVFSKKTEKNLDELLHALVQAADKALEKKEAGQALRDQDRDVEDDRKNSAPAFT